MASHALTTRRDLLAGGVGSLVLTSATSAVRANESAFVPFTYRASDDALADLRHRLALTRWPEHETGRVIISTETCNNQILPTSRFTRGTPARSGAKHRETS